MTKTATIASRAWAKDTFGSAELGDQRRTRRLVKVAADLADSLGASLSSASMTSAGQEGAYRLARNPDVEPEQIAAAGFAAAVERARGRKTILALEDTTSLSYRHESVSDQLGDIGAPAHTPARGFLVHSVLLVDAQTSGTLGLVEQRYWTRDFEERGDRSRHRPYEEKESFKWDRATQALRERFGDRMKHVISVCDREADLYQYLSTKILHAERFVVRACFSRGLDEGYLWQTMVQAREVMRVLVDVPQRGGRRARQAKLSIRTRRVELRRPHRTSARWPDGLGVGVVYVQEVDPPPGVEALEWMLLTNEPVGEPSSALAVLRYYRCRWRIEEFHKIWKSGAGVERCRMQTAANLQRIAVILAFVAERVLELREAFEANPDGPCTTVLTETEWHVLWVAVERKRPPKRPPSVTWAYRAVGRLVNWHDTKRTGRVGPATLAAGWLRLEAYLTIHSSMHLLAGTPTARKK